MALLFACAMGLAPYHPQALRYRARALRAPLSPKCMFNATALIEDAVRAATGNEDYAFGDMTKGAIKSLSGKDAEEYQFGDISRRLAAQAAGKDPEDYRFGDISRRLAAQAAGKDPDEYEFGDITRKVLGDADRALADARDTEQ